MKFILGTATFGARYGIANQNSEMAENECLRVLQDARLLGIESLDVAPVYGDAESIIGKFHETNKNFKVFSKISESVFTSEDKILEQIRKSKEKMQITEFEGISFHNLDLLREMRTREVNQLISKILSSGLTSTVGVSVYLESEIDFVKSRFPDVSLFQVPENVMDRRLVNSEFVSLLSNRGVEFQVRSLFLQGLLLMDKTSLSGSLANAQQGLSQLKDYSTARNQSVLDVCLNYANQIDWASSIVLGATSAEQLSEIVNHKKTQIDLETLPDAFPDSITDPRRWTHS